MTNIFKELFDFFYHHFPDHSLILYLFPITLFLSVLYLRIAGYLRVKKNWRVGFTRKLFHFLVFSTAVVYKFYFSIPGVFILGWAVTAVVFYALWKGEKSVGFKALARPKDAPYEKRYIIYPYLATFAGGVVVNMFFEPPAVMAAFLVAGLGDAIGEPVGTLWGKHPYKVPSWGGISSVRTLEGSSAVYLVCFLSMFYVAYMHGVDVSFWVVMAAAVIPALVEAISPHGWDNFTLQLSGAISFEYILMAT